MLTAFKTTGFVREPETLNDIIRLDNAIWNVSRPSGYLRFENPVVRIYSTADFWANITVFPHSYYESDPLINDNDDLQLIIEVASLVNQGFVHSVQIRFSETDEQSMIDIIYPAELNPHYVELFNLKEAKAYDGRNAFYEAVMTNESKEARLVLKMVSWIFLDRNDVGHWMTITVAITYFDGSLYHQVLVPIELEVTIP